MSTPPTEPMPFPGSNKRPPSTSTLDNDNDNSKRRKEDDGTAASVDGSEPKAKPTRGSRSAKTLGCRNFLTCESQSLQGLSAPQNEMYRRRAGSTMQALHCWESRMHFRRIESWQTYIQVCSFFVDDSNIRTLSPSTRKHELLTRSLRKMERTLDTVLKSIGNPGMASVSGMVSRSPSPSNVQNATQALLSQVDQPPSPTAAAAFSSSSSSRPQGLPPPNSPKLHSLPDNSLNPLGLLAEASLANRRAHAGTSGRKTSAMARPPAAMGVASDAYFKPG